MSVRRLFVLVSVGALVFVGALAALSPKFLWALAVVLPVSAVGWVDMVQRSQAIRRNYPVIGNIRYLFESFRPELQQYFVESNSSGRPFNREQRSLVYRRAKNVVDTLPFGTERDVYAPGYEWMNPSLLAKHPPATPPRIRVGGPACTKPYDAAVMNISAMSFGSLSTAAIRALNLGAKLGGFAHNTGEGGISPYHLQGGDLIWQIGTGYFGCRDREGRFNPESFAERAKLDAVKMIEIKLSQGAKPGHGGILPAKKVTLEIAKIRDVPMGQDVLSPPTHSAFGTPLELCAFIARLRELSGGKPVGFKLCVGKRREFLAIVKAMLESGVTPDFITVDGTEGGTGAAPLEFSNVLGTPLSEAIVFVHNALTGAGLRSQIKIIASGRVISGFDIAHKLAIGADLVNSARAMMFALGCIQAQRCNTNDCPAGVATQDPDLVAGLDVDSKSARVFHYQRNTVKAFGELIAAAGLEHPSELRPWHIERRVNETEVLHYGEIFQYLHDGALLAEPLPRSYERPWRAARAHTFEAVEAESSEHHTETRGLRLVKLDGG